MKHKVSTSLDLVLLNLSLRNKFMQEKNVILIIINNKDLGYIYISSVLIIRFAGGPHVYWHWCNFILSARRRRQWKVSNLISLFSIKLFTYNINMSTFIFNKLPFWLIWLFLSYNFTKCTKLYTLELIYPLFSKYVSLR